MDITLNKGMVGVVERQLVIQGGKIITILVERDGVGTGVAVYCVVFDHINEASDLEVLKETVRRLTLG